MDIKKKAIQLLGGFLILMILFTVLSRAADNMTIAKVKVAKINTGTISHTVKATGQITQAAEVAVTAPAELKVSRVNVSSGQAVAAGDALFSVDQESLQTQIDVVSAKIASQTKSEQQQKQQEAENASKKKLTAQRAQEDYNTAVSKADQANTEAYQKYQNAVNAYNTYIATHTLVRPVQSQSAEESEERSSVDESMYFDQETADSLNAAIDTAKTEYDSTVQSGQETLLSAQRSLEDANADLNTPSDSTQEVSMDQSDKITNSQQLEKLKALQNNGGVIKSPAYTTVTKVNIQPGDQTSDSAALLIADATSGSRLKLTISKDDKKFVAIGTKMILTGAGPDGKEKTVENLAVSAVNASATSDDADKGTPSTTDSGEMVATIEIPTGTFQNGASVSAVLEPEAKNYASCIPIGALHQDDKKNHFVWVITDTDTVLGTQNTIQKVPVTVLDKNSTDAAIEGGSLTSDQQIVTESNKTITEGSRVKVLEP